MDNNEMNNKNPNKKSKTTVNTKAMRNILDASLDEIEINIKKKKD